MPTAQKMSVLTRVKRARDQFQDLTGLEALAVSGLAKIDGGWQVEVDAVEIPRIPDTASLLATYRVTTDEAGDVTTYTRLRHLTPTPATHAA
jgi:hypothetical protein